MTTDITELALIAKIKKQLENFDTVILKEDEALALVEALEKAQQHIARQEKILLNQDESLSIRRGELEAAQQERESWRTSFDNERFRADKLKAHIDDIEPIRAAAEKLVRCKGRYHSEQNYRALAALFGVTTPDLPPLDGEPVAWMVIDIDTGERIIRCDRSYIEGSCQPLYRHAQPVRVVPDDYQRLRELYHAQEKRLFKIAQRIKGPAFDKYSHSPSQAIDVLEGAIFGENDACRAAMLQAGSSPVIPDGYVMVPKEPTAQMYDAGDRQMTTKQVWDAMLAVATQEAK
ncbi:TPA: hypothetical protein NIU63_005266 [Klebsiella michiganensis]|nr:hypothetical protein [Klebsiella michiganensis]